MGCDAHIYIEYKEKDSENKQWYSFGEEISPSRNYLLFAIMAKVRGNSSFEFEAKGLPENIAPHTIHSAYFWISETAIEVSYLERVCNLKHAKDWEKYGNKIITISDKPTWIEDPDYHTFSWLSLDEYQKVLNHYNKEANPKYQEPEYEAILASMKRFEEMGYMARIVFWFDN